MVFMNCRSAEGGEEGGGHRGRVPGGEKLFPKGEVDPIPEWIRELIIRPLEIDGLITKVLKYFRFLGWKLK